MEPSTRQIKFFDTKLQMFESLNFVRNSLITSNRNTGKCPAPVGIISEGKKQGGRLPVLAALSTGVTV
jgi:hypothetical protein